MGRQKKWAKVTEPPLHALYCERCKAWWRPQASSSQLPAQTSCPWCYITQHLAYAHGQKGQKDWTDADWLAKFAEITVLIESGVSWNSACITLHLSPSTTHRRWIKITGEWPPTRRRAKMQENRKKGVA